MFHQPPRKQIKLENGHNLQLEELNIIDDHTGEASSSSHSSDTPAPAQKNPKPKETLIYVDSDDNLLPKRTHLQKWCDIFHGEVTECDGYRLGRLVLKLTTDAPNARGKLDSDFHNANIASRFPGLHSIRMQVEGLSVDSKNVVEFRTRREISQNEAATMLAATKGSKRPPPKDHRFVKLKHFAFTFEKLNVPLSALFGRPGREIEARKIFRIEFEKFDAIYKEIFLHVKLCASAVIGDHNYVEATAPDMTDAIPLLDYYFLNRRNDSTINALLAHHRSSDDAQRFFSLMREYHNYEHRPNTEDFVQDPRMIPELLDYQKDAVVWMLAREGVLELSDEDNNSTEQLQKTLSMNMNTRVSLKTAGNKSLDAYYDRTSGRISWQKRPIVKLPNRGGILADEMGLGKTNECTMLILSNPRPYAPDAESESDGKVKVDVWHPWFECVCGVLLDRPNTNTVTCLNCNKVQHASCVGFNDDTGVSIPNKYFCPHCLVKLPPKPAKSTLVVVPNSILTQWKDEIENNIFDDSLTIYVYSGFAGTKKYQHPNVLSQYDVVLTTYEVLRQELRYTDLPEHSISVRLRDPKRYAAMPCPLILIEWWRVCLDEAQMVENVNWSVAKMACLLPAVNRWCVTGTPIPNGLQDLYGVVCFLGIDPITDAKWWEALVMEPFKLSNIQLTIATNLFGKIFWRTEREYVQDQMRLPRQTVVIHRLEFTPPEKYFYDQRLKHWFDQFKASITDVERDQPISTLSNSQLLPFRQLRHICTHPQLDNEAFQAVDIFIERGAKLTLTVYELVEWLIKRTTSRCLKQYKLEVTELNALAAFNVDKYELDVAAQQYRRVIQLADENKNRWKTDDVNLLHALISLSDVSKKLGLGDGTLDTRADELIGKLMQKKTDEISVMTRAIAFKLIDGNFGSDDDAWWIRVFSYMENSDNEAQLCEDLMRTIKKTIGTVQLESMTLQPTFGVFAFFTSLQDLLKYNLTAIVWERATIFSHWEEYKSSVDALPTYSKVSLLECGHFADGTSSCHSCSFVSNLSYYESSLIRSPQESDHVIEQVWVKSRTQIILDVILQFAKKNQFPADMLVDGKRHIGQFCDLLNEFEELWNWNIAINERMTATHALLQEARSITDNTRSTPLATLPDVIASHSSTERYHSRVIPETPAATSSHNSSHSSTERFYRNSTNPALLATPRPQFSSFSSPEQCQRLTAFRLELSDQKLKDCLRDLEFVKELQIYDYRSDVSSDSLRSETPSAVAVPFTRHTVTNIPSWTITDDKIWRNPFTKIEGVIRTLLTMQKTHPNEKALVICAYDEVLQVLAAEFDQNAISYVLYKHNQSKVNRDALIRYRTDSTQVLLMPLKVASTGLNLTEANHVLLVEPYLNLAIEEQAIGRIHRLGQKKPTFVHRFYIADTIEERLVRMDENKKLSTFVDGNMTVQELLDLFYHSALSANSSQQ